MTIRPYGPGKYDTFLEAEIYEVSLSSGTSEECGSCPEVGLWAAMLVFDEHELVDSLLTKDEHDLLRSHAGVILVENDQGFVSMSWYETFEQLILAWEDVEQEISDLYEEIGAGTPGDVDGALPGC